MWHFTFKDRKNLINLCGYEPMFLSETPMPHLNMEDFTQLFIDEFRKRNFDVDGIEVEFNVDGHNGIRISSITGEDFEIHAAGGMFSTIKIPKKEINLYSDSSSMVLYDYVGDDWEKDKYRFFKFSKVNSKLTGEKKRYIRYESSNGIDKTSNSMLPNLEESYHKKHERKVKLNSLFETCEFNFDIKYKHKYLNYDDDIGREYSPDETENKYYYTSDCLYDVFTWIYQNVYLKIVNTPIPKYIPDSELFKEPEKIEFKNKNKDIYVSLETGFIGVIKNNNIRPSTRVLTLSLKANEDFIYEKIVNDGFVWCELLNTGESLPDYKWARDRNYKNHFTYTTIKLNLDCANEVYIIDNSLKDLVERAESMVHINDYKDNYNEPKVVIRRIVKQNELKVITKNVFVNEPKNQNDELKNVWLDF